MKKVRIALTDINWFDVMSGNKIEQEIEIKQEKDKENRIKTRLEEKKKNSVDWKIYVEWLWFVVL